MKKAFVFLLCFALCLYLIPLPLSAVDSIQYKAINETGPDSYEIGPAESVSDAVYNDQCAGVVVYSLNAGDEPPETSEHFDNFHDKTVIFSNVAFVGHIDCEELYLLGNAKVITMNGKMVITGTSADGEPKNALTEDVLGSYISLQNALNGAEKKYTITESLDIDYPLPVYDLEINEGAVLKLKPSEGGNTNGISVSHSLKVDGSLTAEDGQVLEIDAGCTIEGTSGDFRLYDADGNTEFTFTGEFRETFDYHVDSERWVRRPGGGPGGPGGGDDPQNTFNLNLVYNFDGGSVLLDRFDGNGHMFEPPGNHQILEGSDVNVRIEPMQGYIIQEVYADDGEPLIDNETGSPVTEYTFTNITADHTLYVTFIQPVYEITVTHSGDGQVEVSDEFESESEGSITTYTLMQGENIRFRFYPGNGHRISGILADDQEAELRDEFEFNHVTENHTLHVEFVKKGDGTMHSIAVTAIGSGTIEADGLVNGIVPVEDMFDHMFTFRPEQGWHLKSVIVDKDTISEMDMTHYGVQYNGDGSFSLNLEEVSEDRTLEITFEIDNAEDITFKKYVVTADNDTPEEIAEALAGEFGYISYTVNSEDITVDNIDLSGMDTAGYGTFDFSVTIGGTAIEDQGYIVPTYRHIIFEFVGSHDGNPVNEIRILTPGDIDKIEFGAPAMDSGSMKIYGANGVRLEGITSSDVRDAFIGVTRNEAEIGRAFYRAEWHIANAVDMFGDQGLNLFGLNIIQDDAFCVQVAASGGEGEQREQRTYNWDLNRYAQLTAGEYTSYVFFGNDIFKIRSPESGIGGVISLEIETGDFPGYTVSEDAENQYTLIFLSDFYDNITLNLLINGEIERELTIRRVGVDIQEIEKRSDSNFANVFHGTQNGTSITFNGQNNYQLFAVYYIPDFENTAPYGLYVTYTWADGSTTTEIITQSTDVFLDDVNDNFVSCCDYRLYSAPNKNAAPARVNVIVLRDNPLDADSFGGVYFGSGKGVEWIRED